MLPESLVLILLAKLLGQQPGNSDSFYYGKNSGTAYFVIFSYFANVFNHTFLSPIHQSNFYLCFDRKLFQNKYRPFASTSLFQYISYLDHYGTFFSQKTWNISSNLHLVETKQLAYLFYLNLSELRSNADFYR